MKFFKTITMLLITVITCVGCGQFIVDKTETTNDEKSNDSAIVSDNSNLKAKEESNKYRLDAENYEYDFYEDSNNKEAFDKAIENYNKSIEILESVNADTDIYYDDIAESYNNMGVMQIYRWNFNRENVTDIDDAIESFNKANEYAEKLDDMSSLERVLEHLGYTYYVKWIKDYDDIESRDLSLEYYKKAYDIGPNERTLNNYLGLYYIDMWEQYGYDEEYYTLAEQYLEKAVELDSDYKGALENLAYLHYEKERLNS